MAGRPAIGPAVTVRLPVGLVDWLDGMAERDGVSRSEILRSLLEVVCTQLDPACHCRQHAAILLAGGRWLRPDGGGCPVH